MKIFNLLLILTILACYSGLCSSSPTLASSMELDSESCHKMDNHIPAQKVNYGVQSYNEKGSDNSSCCFNSLINTADDNYVRDFVTLTPTVYISDYILTKDDLRIKRMSLRGHSPPDLQVLNSIFLI